MTLTPEEIQQYHEEGYTVARGLIPRETIQAVRRRLAEIIEDGSDWPPQHLQVLNPDKFRDAAGGPQVFGLQTPASREEVFRAVADHPRLQEAMTQLLGGPVKRFTDQALLKNKAVNGQTFYHQDSYYWHIDPSRGCNCWIALDEVGPGAIALAILPGTHKDWTLAPHEDYYDEPSYHSASTGKAFQRHRIPLDRVDYSKESLLSMAPGDAAFFTNYTWHRAEPNASGIHKYAYAIAYERAD